MIVATSSLVISLADRFRDNVRRLLDEQGLSHAALAKRLKCAPNHVTQTINSSTSGVRTDTIERWAEALGVEEPLELLKN